MGLFQSSEEQRAEELQEAHNQGQKDASEKVGAVQEIVTRHCFAMGGGDDAAKAYDAGIENGRNNMPK